MNLCVLPSTSKQSTSRLCLELSSSIGVREILCMLILSNALSHTTLCHSVSLSLLPSLSCSLLSCTVSLLTCPGVKLLWNLNHSKKNEQKRKLTCTLTEGFNQKDKPAISTCPLSSQKGHLNMYSYCELIVRHSDHFNVSTTFFRSFSKSSKGAVTSYLERNFVQKFWAFAVEFLFSFTLKMCMEAQKVWNWQLFCEKFCQSTQWCSDMIK